MTTKLEQEFFEVFNIPKRFYTIVNLGDLDNNYQEVSANTLQELFEENSFWLDEYIEDIKDFHDWEEKYPFITSDIVLGLINIAISNGFRLFKSLDATFYIAKTGYSNLSGVSKNLNEALFTWAIINNKDVKDQVRALFNAK